MCSLRFQIQIYANVIAAVGAGIMTGSIDPLEKVMLLQEARPADQRQ